LLKISFPKLRACGEKPLTVGVPGVNVGVAEILESCGLELGKPHTRMIMGGADP